MKTSKDYAKALEHQMKLAVQLIEEHFRDWDLGGYPPPSQLKAMKKQDLLNLIEEWRKNPPAQPKRPLIKDVVKAVLTSPELNLLSKAFLAEKIKKAYNKRGLKCNIKTLDWYPSTQGYIAVPRMSAEEFLNGNDKGG